MWIGLLWQAGKASLLLLSLHGVDSFLAGRNAGLYHDAE